MSTIIKFILKFVIIVVVLVVVLLGIAALLLNTQSVQDDLAQYATEQLELKLGTRVKIGHASVKVFTQKVSLEGLEVEDQQHRKMLELGRLLVDVDLLKLISRELEVEEVLLDDVKARLYKPKDGPANYQFLIDAFKKDPKKQKPKTEQKDSTQKAPMALAINLVSIKNIELTFNDTNQVSLESAKYEDTWLSKPSGKLKNLKGQWGFVKKKGPVTATFAIGSIEYKGEKTIHHLNLDQVHFTTNNHKPRKNHDRPKRGFFDVDHLDVTAKMDLTVDFYSKDSLHAVMNNMVARDSVTGFNIKNMHFGVGVLKDRLHLDHIMLQQESTVLKFDSANVVLPSKKQGRKFSFETSRIKGTTHLRDISRPFAPVLKNFIQIINQFTVKKLMMNQLDALGTIYYTGNFSVLYKKEIFGGTLRTDAGNLAFTFALDEKTKYVTGFVDSRRIQLGKVLKMPKLNDVGAKANFTIDIHKARTAMIRKKNGGGKLPIGEVKATVYEAGYGGFRLKNMEVEFASNGTLAEGSVSHTKKMMDWDCTFSFTDVDKMSDLKVKPKMKLKLGNLFRTKKEIAEKEAKDKAKKPKKENVFQKLFKKKKK